MGKVLNMNHEETLKTLDQEIRRLKDEMNYLEKARRLVRKKQTSYEICW